MDRIPAAVKVLIIVNVVVFAIGLIPGVEDPMFELLAMYFPKNPHFQYWQIVTSMFLHGGFLHLLLNMYALWAFGAPLEMMWKKNRFLFFYFASGVGASVIYLAVNYFQFNTTYQEVLALGLSADEIQNLLLTGSYELICFRVLPDSPFLVEELRTSHMWVEQWSVSC